MLFEKLAFKLAADVLGDYTVQGTEIAGQPATIHGQLRNIVGKKRRADAVVLCVNPVAVVHISGISWLDFLLQKRILIWLPGGSFL